MIRLFEPRDLESVQKLITSNTWPFHDIQKPDRKFLFNKNESYFLNDKNRTLIYVDDRNSVRAYIRFYDIENSDTSSPLFDIRLDESIRGNGIGTQLVIDGVKYIFDTFKNLRRIEANTREDNLVMQHILSKIGFTQEARYRKCAKVREGEYTDMLGYAILREEFGVLREVR